MVTRPVSPETYRKKLVRSVNLLIPVVRAVGRGEYKPTPAELILLGALRRIIRDVKPPSAR